MSEAVERCPLCRGTIYYPTDQYGRVVAWCYRCRTTPPPLHLIETPVTRPPNAEQCAVIILALLQANPHQYYLAYHIRNAVAVADQTVRRALALLVSRGDIATVKREGYVSPYYTAAHSE